MTKRNITSPIRPEIVPESSAAQSSASRMEEMVFKQAEHDRNIIKQYRKEDKDFIRHMMQTHESDKTKIDRLSATNAQYIALMVSRTWSKFCASLGGILLALMPYFISSALWAWQLLACALVFVPLCYERQIDDWIKGQSDRWYERRIYQGSAQSCGPAEAYQDRPSSDDQ